MVIQPDLFTILFWCFFFWPDITFAVAWFKYAVTQKLSHHRDIWSDTQSTTKVTSGRNTRSWIINWSPIYSLWHAPFMSTEDWGNAVKWAWKAKIGKGEFLAEDEVCKALVWPTAGLQAFDRTGFSTEGTLISASAAPQGEASNQLA